MGAILGIVGGLILAEPDLSAAVTVFAIGTAIAGLSYAVLKRPEEQLAKRGW